MGVGCRVWGLEGREQGIGNRGQGVKPEGRRVIWEALGTCGGDPA